MINYIVSVVAATKTNRCARDRTRVKRSHAYAIHQRPLLDNLVEQSAVSVWRISDVDRQMAVADADRSLADLHTCHSNPHKRFSLDLCGSGLLWRYQKRDLYWHVVTRLVQSRAVEDRRSEPLTARNWLIMKAGRSRHRRMRLVDALALISFPLFALLQVRPIFIHTKRESAAKAAARVARTLTVKLRSRRASLRLYAARTAFVGSGASLRAAQVPGGRVRKLAPRHWRRANGAMVNYYLREPNMQVPVYANVGLPSALLPVPLTLSSQRTSGPAIWSNRYTDPASAPVARFTSKRNLES